MKMIDFKGKITIACLCLSVALFFLSVLSLVVCDASCGSVAICATGVSLTLWLVLGCLATALLALFFVSILFYISLNKGNW